MIEGLHETFDRVRIGNSGTIADHATRVFAHWWAIEITDSQLVYSTAPIDIQGRTRGALTEKWRVAISAVRSFIITPSSDYDSSLYRTQISWFDISGCHYFGTREIHDDKEKPTGRYHAPDHRGKGGYLVLYVFMVDGSRNLISMRADVSNKIDGTRGYDALLQQQTQLTDAVHGARRRRQEAKKERIERARYL